MTIESLIELREELPGTRLVQVIYVTGPEAIEMAAHTAPVVDAILLDSPSVSVRQVGYGTTGTTHDWSISRRIVSMLEVPVILAGGLTPENVTEAIRQVRPFAIDVCTGVRDHDYRLIESKVLAFMHAVSSVTNLGA